MITHTGDAELANGLKLKNVLYIPTFKHNLLSVQKLTIDKGCKVDFHPEYCIIQEKDGKVLGVGKAVHGLYYMINKPIEELVKSWKKRTDVSTRVNNNYQERGMQAMNAEGKVRIPDTINDVPNVSATTLWHWRLGHAPLQRISKIAQLKGFKHDNNEVCITCPLARFTKLPYKLSESRASRKLELIHIDIWGPYKMATRHNQRYFLTIVDDYSRVTWVNLLKQKSNAFEAIQNFVHMCHTQFEKKVKVIRSDNALEFDDKQCQPFFAKLGIVHQTSCVDRPEQNGRVERKHRNILEMARALRFQSGLPLQFWGDCVLCAVHITNRLPNSVVEAQSF